jgi:hypothetical protein
VTAPTNAPEVRRTDALRVARERLRLAAARGPSPAFDDALRAFLRAAHAEGFAATTACSVACAAIVEGLPPRPRRAAEAQAREYYLRVRDVYRSLEPGLLGDLAPAVRRC